MDCSLPGSSVYGIFQAGVLEWGAIAFSETKAYEIIKLYSVYIALSSFQSSFSSIVSVAKEGINEESWCIKSLSDLLNITILMNNSALLKL